MGGGEKKLRNIREGEGAKTLISRSRDISMIPNPLMTPILLLSVKHFCFFDNNFITPLSYVTVAVAVLVTGTGANAGAGHS